MPQARGDITRWMAEQSGPDVRFTTMFDLFRLPGDFPGYGAPAAGPQQRVDALQDAMLDDIGDERLLPYIQLHEFEALVLSAPEMLARLVPRIRQRGEPACGNGVFLLVSRANRRRDGTIEEDRERNPGLFQDVRRANRHCGDRLAETAGAVPPFRRGGSAVWKPLRRRAKADVVFEPVTIAVVRRQADQRWTNLRNAASVRSAARPRRTALRSSHGTNAKGSGATGGDRSMGGRGGWAGGESGAQRKRSAGPAMGRFDAPLSPDERELTPWELWERREARADWRDFLESDDDER